jgi:glutamate synthase (NADPH/NADH) small chain
MGFLYPPLEGMLSGLKIEITDRGNIKTTGKSYQTNIPKIFSAGDMRRGQSLVVWAIHEGRECAKDAHRFLSKS